MGLPGLNGFIGEFTILLGAFGSTALGIALVCRFGCFRRDPGGGIFAVDVPEIIPGTGDKEENKVLRILTGARLLPWL